MKKLWLRIWNKIKRFFGQKEMEIKITINKWLASLDNNLRNVNNKDEVYEYCVLVKSMVSNYSTSVLQLSKQGKELQAKVVLRTFAELAITFCWCIKDANKEIVKFYSKNERWHKKSLIEQRKFLKRSSECFDDAKIRDNLQICEKNIKVLDDKGTKNLPDNMGLCRDLFGSDADLNYFILFGQFHEVVHSNLFLLARLKISGIDNKIFDSYSDNVTVLNQVCMACIYLVIKYIYEFYGMDFSSIESDYSRLKN